MPSDYTLAESAIALHEYFISLIEAGFDPEQALRIVCTAISSGFQSK